LRLHRGWLPAGALRLQNGAGASILPFGITREALADAVEARPDSLQLA
jgi:hypothetical protein